MSITLISDLLFSGASWPQTITVPSNCTLVVFSYAAFVTGGWVLPSAPTLAGFAFTDLVDYGAVFGTSGSVGAWYLQNPATGSQTLNAPSSGAAVVFVSFFMGADPTTPFRDSAAGAGTTSPGITVVAGDLCFTTVYSYATDATASGGGQTQVDATTGNLTDSGALGAIIAASSGTLTMQATGANCTQAVWSMIPAGNLIVPVGALAITGYAPSVTGIGLTVIVPIGALAITGFAPALTLWSTSIPTGTLIITGYPPAVFGQLSTATMTGGKGYALSDGLLNYFFNAGSLPTIGADLYAALFTSAPTDYGGGVEVTGGSYARLAVARNTTNFPTSTTGTEAITCMATLNFVSPTADWGATGWFAWMSAATGGYIVYWAPLSSPVTILSGVPFTLGPASITFTEA
jgi:hypothetical protein